MNNNIQESYCSFEVSKLLKEKGFNARCSRLYDEDSDELKIGFNTNSFNKRISAPAHALAIEWLRVNFGIWIYVLPYSTLFRPYAEELVDLDRFGKWEGHKYNSPQEATEAALLYTLQNFIP